MEVKFLTIRKTAQTGILSEYNLQLMERLGRLPGIRTGNRFLINLPLLVEQLNRESLDQMQSEASDQ